MAKDSAAINQAVHDIAKSQKQHDEFLKQQILFEIIQVAAVCSTYNEFRNALFGMALDYMQQMEKDGLAPKGTTEKIKQGLMQKEEK